MSEIMTDLDDAMRMEKINAFWIRYGRLLLGLSTIAIVATVMVVIWRNVMEKRYLVQSGVLMTVLEAKEQNSETAAKLIDLSAHAAAPLNNVVEFYKAHDAERLGDLTKAQDAYKTVMNRPQASGALKQLATIHYVRLGMMAKQDAGLLLSYLTPLISDSRQAFYGSAMELRGLLLRQQGNSVEANKVFSDLSTLESIPATLRQRAKSLIRYE